MRTRAKLKLDSLTAAWGGGVTISLTPVGGTSEENKRFFHATPNGKVDLTLSPDAVRALGFERAHLGKEFYLDITPAENPADGMVAAAADAVRLGP